MTMLDEFVRIALRDGLSIQPDLAQDLFQAALEQGRVGHSLLLVKVLQVDIRCRRCVHIR
jgi:hypothetical protein